MDKAWPPDYHHAFVQRIRRMAKCKNNSYLQKTLLTYMRKTTLSDNSIARMPLAELRRKWEEFWSIQPHVRIGRQMLERSLEFRMRGGFSVEQQARLDHLIAGYRRNPKSFDQGAAGLKPGTKLIRTFGGERHAVLVKADGFEYRGKVYGSLSEVARLITGTKWNGWLFFGLKKRGKA